jgi:hypothetical protein
LKIHIVYPGPGAARQNNILTRLAQVLADGTGWGLGIKPDPAADLNYYIPYLLFNRNYHATMTAGWFTHREEGWPEKENLWRKAAEGVDLRTTSTRLYHEPLKEIGTTALVTPPVDPAFRPLIRPSNQTPLVGIAGYVYDSGRKGEYLVKQLMGSDLMNRIELTAAGRGWPCLTKDYSFERLPEFYNSLDVLLCTSRIEGPGYPPLEALACGTQVVIPRGVGIFDELPDVTGIHRYECDNYDGLKQALRHALETRTDREALAGAVAKYTAEAWVEDHRQAFRTILSPIPRIPGRLPAWSGDNAGVYLVAYGDPARKCAETCINSWHHFMPGLPVCLVSDEPLGPEDVFVEHPDRDIGGRFAKTRIYDLAPKKWKYVVYVDADTELISSVSFLFDLLSDGWEMFICYNPAQYVLGREMVRSDNKDECEATFDQIGTDEFVQMNGGAFGFQRNERTAAFFGRWHEEWGRWGKRDQAAFDRVLYGAPLRIYTLGVEWNLVTRYYPAERSAGIVHYPTLARRWQGIVHGRLDSPEAWKQAGLR